jgi:leader peptidase (prepilin peptidase) / N-methyltransferase
MYISSAFTIAAFGAVGLCVGSFLNVVIHRLPQMLEAQFEAQTDTQYDAKKIPKQALTLSTPASRCGHCGHLIRWFENIPVLSYLFLRGRCSACQTSIGIRYPLIELAASAIFSYAAWRWYTPQAALASALTSLGYAGFGTTLLALAAIDWDTTYLPDDITVPLTWAGLCAAGLGWLPIASLHSALAGAVIGYLSLWSIYWIFKLVTGREGMGYGDFKLYAAIGAWLGWQGLIPVILVAASLGSVVGIAMKLLSREREGGYVPFGPFLAFGAVLELVTQWQF